MTLCSVNSLAMSRPPGTFTHSVLWQETDKPDALGELFIVVGFRVVVEDQHFLVVRHHVMVVGSSLDSSEFQLIQLVVQIFV